MSNDTNKGGFSLSDLLAFVEKRKAEAAEKTEKQKRAAQRAEQLTAIRASFRQKRKEVAQYGTVASLEGMLRNMAAEVAGTHLAIVAQWVASLGYGNVAADCIRDNGTVDTGDSMRRMLATALAFGEEAEADRAAAIAALLAGRDALIE